MLGRRTSGVLFKGGGLALLVLVLVVVVRLVVVGGVELFGPNTTDSLIDSRATIQGGRRGLAVELSLASTHE